MADLELIIGWTVVPSLAAGPGYLRKPCSGFGLFPMVSVSEWREKPGDFVRADAFFFAVAFFFAYSVFTTST